MEKPYRRQVRIRFVDTDASGRIHYTAMFRHFEAVEQDWMNDLEIPSTGADFRGIGFPRVHVECDFLSELQFDDLVDITLAVDRVGTSSYTLAYGVENRGKPAAKGRITIVCLDKLTQRATAIPDRLARSLRELIG